MPELSPMPVLFVPGVRSGPDRCDGDTVLGADVMRGEEVLALGLAGLGHLAGGGVFLNLGSHWKAIRVDGDGRVAGSASTLSGELIFAVQSQTILASALPQGRPAALAPRWTDAGGRAFRAAGLARALYCVRLLEQRGDSTPEERLAFLVGAVMAADRAALVPEGGRVAVVGAAALAGAWARMLAAEGASAEVIGEGEIERAFRAGCRRVLEAREAAA
jgi:2-dehydro-3-deoxygalactonokinase